MRCVVCVGGCVIYQDAAQAWERGEMMEGTTKRNRSGSILPLAVVLVVILAIIGLALIRLGFDARIMAIRKSAEIVARCAADAGVSRAARLMNMKLAVEKSWDMTPIPPETGVALPNSYSNYSYTVAPKNADGHYLITSIGRSHIAEKIVNCKLEFGTLWFGIGVKEGINIMVGATFTAPPGSDFSIRTNSTDDDAIVLKAGVTIPGDVICGPGGDTDEVINIKSTTVIEGESWPAEDEIDFPPVDVPDELENPATTIAYTYQPGVPIGDPNFVGTQYFRFNEIYIPQSGVQEVMGDCKIYVVDQTILGQSAELIVTPGATLALYLGGNLEAKNSNGIDNENTDASALKIFGTDTCEHIDLKAKGDVFLGYCYAPEADLDVYAKNELAGAFIGKSFNMKSGANFTYIPPPGGDMKEEPAYLVVRWWEE